MKMKEIYELLGTTEGHKEEDNPLFEFEQVY